MSEDNQIERAADDIIKSLGKFKGFDHWWCDIDDEFKWIIRDEVIYTLRKVLGR